MKNLLLASIVLVTGLVSMGCSSPCDALSDLCKKCPDATIKSSCEQVVSTYRLVPNGGSACQAVLDADTYRSCK